MTDTQYFSFRLSQKILIWLMPVMQRVQKPETNLANVIDVTEKLAAANCSRRCRLRNKQMFIVTVSLESTDKTVCQPFYRTFLNSTQQKLKISSNLTLNTTFTYSNALDYSFLLTSKRSEILNSVHRYKPNSRHFLESENIYRYRH